MHCRRGRVRCTSSRPPCWETWSRSSQSSGHSVRGVKAPFMRRSSVPGMSRFSVDMFYLLYFFLSFFDGKCCFGICLSYFGFTLTLFCEKWLRWMFSLQPRLSHLLHEEEGTAWVGGARKSPTEVWHTFLVAKLYVCIVCNVYTLTSGSSSEQFCERKNLLKLIIT